MENYLIDTVIIIAYLNGEKHIIEKFKTININISCISVGELVAGASSSRDREKNLHKISILLKKAKVYKINKDISYHYGLIKSHQEKIGKVIPINDYWIAATAKEHDLILVSRDKHLLELDMIKTERW